MLVRRLTPFVSSKPVTPYQMEDYAMTTLTAPAPQANPASDNGEKPINLFQLGCLFVIRASQKVLPDRQRATGLPLVAGRGREQGNRQAGSLSYPVRLQGADRPAQGPQGLSADREEGPKRCAGNRSRPGPRLAVPVQDLLDLSKSRSQRILAALHVLAGGCPQVCEESGRPWSCSSTWAASATNSASEGRLAFMCTA
jgi:hypothetical protein